MRTVPTATYRLRSRRQGAFGSSRSGRVFEWLTLTWFRFEAFLAWLVLLAIIVAARWPSARFELGLLLISPAIAVAMTIGIRGAFLVLYFVPGASAVAGWCRLVFLWVFSRLVVERAPEIDIPLWKS